MSKVGQWVFEMQEDAYHMSRDQFIFTHGASQVGIWDQLHAHEEFDEPEPEFEYYGA